MSSGLSTPLHVGVINGRDVRFFRDPSGKPGLPWHVADDLFRAADLPRNVRRHLIETAQKAFGDELRTIPTADGVVTIAPHTAAQAFLHGVAKASGGRVDLEREYIAAGVNAMDKLTGDLPPVARFEFAMAAAKNTIGGGQ